MALEESKLLVRRGKKQASDRYEADTAGWAPGTLLPGARAGHGLPCLHLWDQSDCEVSCQGALGNCGGETGVCVCVCVCVYEMCVYYKF